ncbi:peptidoglycan endopeptidase [Mycolicibacterium komossense]|uniref:peptidoglycan endopeptidase n=1 Tax=Mycolicibacterium komossense TaxID=1779 RepID=UPI003F49406E
MIDLAAVMMMIQQVQGTPYITGGDSPRGTDCSGLASWVSNMATGRPVYGDRFHTANEAAALRARGFQDGTAPNSLVIGWNGSHTAVTLPDGTPVSSGEGGGVKIGGGGAYQPQFTHHMYLPMPDDGMNQDPGVVPVDIMNPELPPPPMDPGAPLADVPPPADAPVVVNADNVELPPPPGDPALPPQAA